jgi:S-adenosylmethionine synthetase
LAEAQRYLFTSESVTEGHPDKIADQISDAVLDAVLTDDPTGRVACEVLVTTGTCIVAGEITTKTYVDVPRIARGTIEYVGYNDASYGFDSNTCGVHNLIQSQSPDISMGVDTGGAGDQGLMFGYACDETAELMPLPIMMAHKLCRRLSDARREGILDFLRPDGKSQVSVEYVDNKPKRIEAVVISTQHSPEISQEELVEPGQEAHHRCRGSVQHGGLADQVPHQSDRPLRGRRSARRHRTHGPQDHRRYLRRHGPSRRRRIQRQGSDEGGPLGLLQARYNAKNNRGRRNMASRCEVQLATPSGGARTRVR